MQRLVDPPRDIPLGLRLGILCYHDVANPILFLPAALMLLAAFKPPDMPMRVAFFTIGSLFLWLGLRNQLPALWRGFGTLRRMRLGYVTVGHITSCHLAWDRKDKDMPYREFLGDWVVNTRKSQMDKASGCFAKLIAVAIVVPFVVMAVIVGFVAVAFQWHVPGVDLSWSSVDAPYLAKWAAMSLAGTAAIVVMLKFLRSSERDQVVPFMEWQKLANPGRHDVYDDAAMEQVEEAKRRGVKISLKEPLPADSRSAVDLECTIDYSLAGQPCTATGRARLCKLLDLDGFEPLVFDPLRPQRVDLFVGLPEEVAIDAQSQWAAVPGAVPALRLLLAGGAALVAIAAFAVHVQDFTALHG
jgi:hypothetical protein